MPLDAGRAAKAASIVSKGNSKAHAPHAPEPWASLDTTLDEAAKARKAFREDPWGTTGQALMDEMHALKNLMSFHTAESVSHEDAVDAFNANAEAVGDAAYRVAEAKGALATFGAAVGTLTAIEQALSVPFSMIPFPALPACRVSDVAIGTPHGHMHPPSLTPPAVVPIPLPSAGPIIPIPFVSGAGRVLINNLPAARCGDFGLGLGCCGFFPMYEILLGSSSVWIEGCRAARMTVDITMHCIFTVPKPTDVPVGPSAGTTVTASPNVVIGGVPLPSLTANAMGKSFKAVFKGLGKLNGISKAADDVADDAAKAADDLADDAGKVAEDLAEDGAKAADDVVDDAAKNADDAADGPLDTSNLSPWSFDWLNAPTSGADDMAKKMEDVLDDLEQIHGPADGGAKVGNAVGGKNAGDFPARADNAGSEALRGKTSEDHAKAAQKVLDHLDKVHGEV